MEDRKDNLDKLMSAIAYICHEFASTPDALGSIMLNKILWFADVGFYSKTGRTITGYMVYTKQEHGPVLTDILKALDTLIDNNIIWAVKKDYGDYLRWRYRIVGQKEVHKLIKNIKHDEKDMLKKWIEVAKEKGGKYLEQQSHNNAWWDVLKTNASIFVGLGYKQYAEQY